MDNQSMKFATIKLLIAIIISYLFCSCSLINAMNEAQREFNAVRYAVTNKVNLSGLTQNEVINRFGSPDKSDTSYSGDTRHDTWRYTDPLWGTMTLYFRDYVVTSVYY